jgi:hypothetical protein
VSVEAEAVYDWDEVDRRTAAAVARRPGGRGGVAAAVLAAALWAVDDVVLGERPRSPVIEEAEIPGPDPRDRVVVHLVPGDARASWARVRGG